MRPLYFTILITHVTLAAAVLPLAIVTLSRGLKARYPQHRAIARWTLPIWLYVSVTGVLVYVLLISRPGCSEIPDGGLKKFNRSAEASRSE